MAISRLAGAEEAGGLYDQEIAGLYKEFADQVYGLVRRGLSHEDAEEVVNSAFLAARVHWGRVRTYTFPVAYVMRTARNLRADVFARGARYPTVSLDDEDVPVTGAVDVMDEEVWALREALRRLSPREEEVVILYYWTGLPAKEIAQALGTSPGHISRTLSDARARLHRLLSPPAGGGGKDGHDR